MLDDEPADEREGRQEREGKERFDEDSEPGHRLSLHQQFDRRDGGQE